MICRHSRLGDLRLLKHQFKLVQRFQATAEPVPAQARQLVLELLDQDTLVGKRPASPALRLVLDLPGFEELYRSGRVREVACMAHVRRKFFDVYASQGSAIAAEALQRIAALYAIETLAQSSAAQDHRQEPSCRGDPLCALPAAPLRPYLEHGILEIDNNTCERSIRGIAVGGYC